MPTTNKRSSLLADEDDLIPLIDIQSSTEDIPEMVSFPAKRQNSASMRQVQLDRLTFIIYKMWWLKWLLHQTAEYRVARFMGFTVIQEY